MAGTIEGGRKMHESLIKKMGEAEYRAWRKKIGAMGGKKSRGGGFKDRELAAEAGRKGGLASRKKKYDY